MFTIAFLCGLGGILGIIAGLVPYFLFAEFWKWLTKKPAVKDTIKLLENRNELTERTNLLLADMVEALKEKD